MAVIGCSKKFESSSLVQVSLEGYSPSMLIDKFRKSEPTLKFSEVKNTDLIKASLKTDNAQQAAQKVNNCIDKLQKQFKTEYPKGSFIIWERAVPATIGTYL